jgi:hypothetical protein
VSDSLPGIRLPACKVKAGREQEVYDEVMDVIFKLSR